MDEETRAALDLTKDELRAMRDAAEPGVVAKRPKRPRDLNQRATDIVREATEASDLPSGIRPTWDEDSLVVTQVTFGGHGVTAFVVSSSAETTNCVPA